MSCSRFLYTCAARFSGPANFCGWVCRAEMTSAMVLTLLLRSCMSPCVVISARFAVMTFHAANLSTSAYSPGHATVLMSRVWWRIVDVRVGWVAEDPGRELVSHAVVLFQQASDLLRGRCLSVLRQHLLRHIVQQFNASPNHRKSSVHSLRLFANSHGETANRRVEHLPNPPRRLQESSPLLHCHPPALSPAWRLLA